MRDHRIHPDLPHREGRGGRHRKLNDRTLQIKVDLQSGRGNDDQRTILVDDRDWRVARPIPDYVVQIWLRYEEVGLAYMGRSR